MTVISVYIYTDLASIIDHVGAKIVLADIAGRMSDCDEIYDVVERKHLYHIKVYMLLSMIGNCHV